MRILYVTDGIAPHVIGGMQSIARAQVRSLIDAGYEIILITSRSPPGEKIDLPCRNVELNWPTRTTLMKLNPWRYVNDLRKFSELVALVADEARPDAIYSEGPLLDAYLVRPRAERVPVIFHPHGLEMYQHKGSLIEDFKSLPLRGIVARHCRLADIVISLGGRLTDLICKLGVDRSKIAILPNCGPLPIQQAKPRGNNGRFLFVGRAERRKGVDVLLNAIAICTDARLDIVGMKGTDTTIDRVTFHGPIRNRNVIMQYYLQAGYLVLPSFAEGMPTVILEAFSSGLPVIATNVGAVNELVRDDETGFLVEPGDANALANAMKRAILLPEDAYQRMSDNCAAIVRTSFSREHTRARLVEIFGALRQ